MDSLDGNNTACNKQNGLISLSNSWLELCIHTTYAPYYLETWWSARRCDGEPITRLGLNHRELKCNSLLPIDPNFQHIHNIFGQYKDIKHVTSVIKPLLWNPARKKEVGPKIIVPCNIHPSKQQNRQRDLVRPVSQIRCLGNCSQHKPHAAYDTGPVHTSNGHIDREGAFLGANWTT